MDKGADEQILNELFEAEAPAIEERVTRAVHTGQRVRDVAVVIERKFSGEVARGCMTRAAVDRHLRSIQGIDGVARQMIVAAVNNAMATEVPVVLLVHKEGFISVGIRRVAGKLTWLS